jgi:hypothetical protein
MRRLPLSCIFLACCCLSDLIASAQMTSNVLSRVLKIKVGTEQGTSFTMEVDGRQYLVTAKHVVANIRAEGAVEIFKDGQWTSIPMKVFKCDDPIDIAILVPPTPLTGTLPLEPNSEGLMLAQDVYFLGFPHGFSANSYNLNGPYPFPLVKKGAVSALERDNGIYMIVRDGHNNPGFSGGPVVFRDLRRPLDISYRIAAVITAYYPELTPVVAPGKIKPGEDTSKIDKWRLVKLPDGKMAKLTDTDRKVPLNSGIVVSYEIGHAVDLIRKHPIGPKVTD